MVSARQRLQMQPEIGAHRRYVGTPRGLSQAGFRESPGDREFPAARLPQPLPIKRPDHRIQYALADRSVEFVSPVVGRHEIEFLVQNGPRQTLQPLRGHPHRRTAQHHAHLRPQLIRQRKYRLLRARLAGHRSHFVGEIVDRIDAIGNLHEPLGGGRLLRALQRAVFGPSVGMHNHGALPGEVPRQPRRSRLDYRSDRLYAVMADDAQYQIGAGQSFQFARGLLGNIRCFRKFRHRLKCLRPRTEIVASRPYSPSGALLVESAAAIPPTIYPIDGTQEYGGRCLDRVPARPPASSAPRHLANRRRPPRHAASPPLSSHVPPSSPRVAPRTPARR